MLRRKPKSRFAGDNWDVEALAEIPLWRENVERCEIPLWRENVEAIAEIPPQWENVEATAEIPPLREKIGKQYRNFGWAVPRKSGNAPIFRKCQSGHSWEWIDGIHFIGYWQFHWQFHWQYQRQGMPCLWTPTPGHRPLDTGPRTPDPGHCPQHPKCHPSYSTTSGAHPTLSTFK